MTQKSRWYRHHFGGEIRCCSGPWRWARTRALVAQARRAGTTGAPQLRYRNCHSIMITPSLHQKAGNCRNSWWRDHFCGPSITSIIIAWFHRWSVFVRCGDGLSGTALSQRDSEDWLSWNCSWASCFPCESWCWVGESRIHRSMSYPLRHQWEFVLDPNFLGVAPEGQKVMLGSTWFPARWRRPVSITGILCRTRWCIWHAPQPRGPICNSWQHRSRQRDHRCILPPL